MKRILFGGVLVASLILLQPSSAPLAEKKKPSAWKSAGEGVKVLRVWEVPELSLKWPQVAFMQLSEEKQRELQSDPLKFLQKYKIFENTDQVIGQFFVRLMEPGAQAKDPVFTVAAHGSATYSGIASFAVDKIE